MGSSSKRSIKTSIFKLKVLKVLQKNYLKDKDLILLAPFVCDKKLSVVITAPGEYHYQGLTTLSDGNNLIETSDAISSLRFDGKQL